MKPILYIVIPCYNEEQVLPLTAPLFRQKLEDLTAAGKISPDSRVLFVNDGSKDGTWAYIRSLAASDEHYKGLCLSRNRGHQNALLAGLMTAKDQCDITISIDCDGQDDLNAMEEMVDAYLEGADVVYGIRRSRESDSWFKRTSAQTFYRLLRFMGADVIYNHADYRLMSRRALDALSQFREVNIYLRGMVPMVGFHSTSVYYDRRPRLAGKSHYPFRKMLALAFSGITSLSVKPIRMITASGILVALLSFIGILWSIIQVIRGMTVPGWASITCILCFLGGVQLISLGIIGEYVGKIYLETKARPRYIIEETTGALSPNPEASKTEFPEISETESI